MSGDTPPPKPESPSPPDYWGWFVFHHKQISDGSIGEWIAVGFIFGWPGFALYAGYKGLLTGKGFWGGALYSILPVVAVTALVVVPILALNMLSHWADARRERAEHRKDLAVWPAQHAAWEEGAPARAAARRRARGLEVFDTLLQDANAKRMQPVLAARQAAQRRAALEAQVREMFRQYRLRNDWDASDPTLVPRLQTAFRKWMRDTPPFPPEDMALLATSADAATRALLPASTASHS